MGLSVLSKDHVVLHMVFHALHNLVKRVKFEVKESVIDLVCVRISFSDLLERSIADDLEFDFAAAKLSQS